MRLKFTKSLIFISLVLLISACLTNPTPLAQSQNGRTAINGKQAASMFQKFCFNTNGRPDAIEKEVQKSGNFTHNPGSIKIFYSESHNTLAFDVITLGNTGCAINFIAPKSSEDGVAEAAFYLVEPTGAKDIARIKSAPKTQISLKTAKGDVIISNTDSDIQNSVEIILLRK